MAAVANLRYCYTQKDGNQERVSDPRILNLNTYL